jgi:hypothetical protein
VASSQDGAIHADGIESMGEFLFHCSRPIPRIQDTFDPAFEISSCLNLFQPKQITSHRKKVNLNERCDYNRHHDHLLGWRYFAEFGRIDGTKFIRKIAGFFAILIGRCRTVK